jgi:ComF family protein
MLRSYAVFQDPLRKAIHHLKYKQDLALAVTLAEPLMDWISNQLKWHFDMILTVPLNQERMKSRGFNQSNLISFPISIALDVPFLPKAVRRVKNTLSQVGLSAAQRKENVKDAFVAEKSIVNGKTILLIDDVVTTGATIAACSEALLQAGATKVFCLSVAKTPYKFKIHDKINEFAT